MMSTSIYDENFSWDLGKLAEVHERFIEKILEEEDELIVSHKNQIDSITELSKEVKFDVK